MKPSLEETLRQSRLDDEATRFARRAISAEETVVSGLEAIVEKDSFERIYALRADNLTHLGKSTWNFQELLAAVGRVQCGSVGVSLLEIPEMKIVVVRTEEGELIGCAAFGR